MASSKHFETIDAIQKVSNKYLGVKSALLVPQVKLPTIKDTRRDFASGHDGLFALGIDTYKYPTPTRQFGLAAPLRILTQFIVCIPKESHQSFTQESPKS